MRKFQFDQKIENWMKTWGIEKLKAGKKLTKMKNMKPNNFTNYF